LIWLFAFLQALRQIPRTKMQLVVLASMLYMNQHIVIVIDFKLPDMDTHMQHCLPLYLNSM
jgi:hypothetical protein